MAFEIVIANVLGGIILGLRFKVMVLVPAIALAALLAAIVGVARADQFWYILWTIILFGSAVQFGYVVGIFLRAAIASICAPPTGGHNSEVGHT
jgi:hypothetical protein